MKVPATLSNWKNDKQGGMKLEFDISEVHVKQVLEWVAELPEFPNLEMDIIEKE